METIAKKKATVAPFWFAGGLVLSVIGIVVAIASSDSLSPDASLPGVLLAAAGVSVAWFSAVFWAAHTEGPEAAVTEINRSLCRRCSQPLVGRGASFCPRCGLKVE